MDYNQYGPQGNMQQNPYNGPQYNQYQNMGMMQPMPKKKAGFGIGFFVGLLVTAVALIGGTVVVSKVYTNFTGRYIVLGPKENGTTAYHGDLVDQDTLDRVEELIAYMDLYYYEDYDESDIQDAICKGTLEGLGDPYSVYYTADEYADLQVSTSGSYAGIGAGLIQDAKTMEVTVSKVYESTPAEEAGLEKNDQILMVDDIDATSMELTNLVKNIRGEAGTVVHLTIYRESTDETLELDVERREVNLPSVTGKMIDDKIGYMEISEFQTNTAKQFDTILADLQDQGMEGLVVDLRGNPGGLVTAVVDVLDTILPEGTVVYTEDKYGNRDTYTSDPDCLKCPIVVLVDENSASASEIFAGAIKDYKYGKLVGKTTFGKGIVQTIFPLENGAAVKVTTAKYYTPKGNNIHGTGIDPDYEVDYEYSGPEDADYDMQYDSQAQYALDLMREMLE